MSQLADLLKHQMEVRGWSKRKLEEITGIARTSIDNILDNENAVPRLETLDILGRTFGLPLWRMVELCGYDLGLPKTAGERAKRLTAVMEAMPQFQPIVDHLMATDPDKLDGILSYLEWIRSRGGQ
jgi:transcriptional regulator with XRE-family HTH domain